MTASHDNCYTSAGMKKITISEIASEVYSFRGFDHVGCHGCGCDDACCVYGADFDKESYQLVIKNRDLVEGRTGTKVEDCFTGEWSGDREFLGGDNTASRVGSSGYCMFHVPAGKGCVLFNLVMERGLPRRMIPSICRLYPLTWSDGELMIAEDLYPRCNCTYRNRTTSNLLETQKHEMEDIFDIKTGSP